MAFVRSILSALLTVALAAYAFDCSAAATAEQAMQCCNSMRCMAHHQAGQDCCKSMPSARVEVGQPTSANIAFSPLILGLADEFIESSTRTASARAITDPSHAPPLFIPPSVLPLRI
jgi:hypothetical protein